MVERSLGVGEATGSIPVSPTIVAERLVVGNRGIAQLAERLVRNQEVLSSSLSTPTSSKMAARGRDALERGRPVFFADPLRALLTNH